jgi:hypothetical protein
MQSKANNSTKNKGGNYNHDQQREEETILDATRKAQCPPAKMYKLLIVDHFRFPRGICVVMEFIGVVEKIVKLCDVRRV